MINISSKGICGAWNPEVLSPDFSRRIDSVNQAPYLTNIERRRGRMKQTLSDLARAKEATFWGNIKKVMVQNPGKVCHK
jgi:hypothetical protein